MPVNPFFKYVSPVQPLLGSDLAALFIHRIDVEEQTDDVLTDDAGDAVPVWQQIASGFACSIIPLSYQERLDWQQRGVIASDRAFIPAPVDGQALPVINNRCRVVFGTRPDGSPRRLAVVWSQDAIQAGVLLEVLLFESFPGGSR